MLRLSYVCFLGLSLVGGRALADVVAIPLPNLAGTYPATRIASIHLTQRPSVIRSATFVVHGTTVVGEVDCFDGPSPWPMSLTAYLEDNTTGDHWYAPGSMPDVSGPFEWETELRTRPTYPPATWALLMDGDADIKLSGSTAFTVCAPTALMPTAQVDEAILYLDADFVVPTRSGTWGVLKAFYR